MLSGQAPSFASAPLPDFLPVWISASNALLYHAPIRIKVFDFHRTRENEQRLEVPKRYHPSSRLVFTSHPCPVSRDPENDRFQAVSKRNKQLSWLWVPAFQWLTAWSVKMQPSRVKKRGGTSLQSTGMVLPAKIRVPRSSPLFKRTFSPPGKEHDLS